MGLEPIQIAPHAPQTDESYKTALKYNKIHENQLLSGVRLSAF
jgi:hypothetical protein